MTIEDFLKEFQDLLQRDNPVFLDTSLAEMEEWDSLAFMVTIAFFDKKFGQRLVFDELRSCQTVQDVVTLAKGAIG